MIKVATLVTLKNIGNRVEKAISMTTFMFLKKLLVDVNMDDVYFKVNLWKKSGTIFKFLTMVTSRERNNTLGDRGMKQNFNR